MRAQHRTARIYQAALALLRERHSEEFDELYAQLLAREGIEMRNTERQRLQKAIIEFVDAYCAEHKTGPHGWEICEVVDIPPARLRLYMRELAEAGIIQLPGSGGGYSNPGYRINAKAHA